MKGTDKTVGALTGMRKGLNETASTSLEAKAALVGVFYAIERLFSASNKVGNSLTNFSALVGEGSQTLQQYQYAGRLVGVTNEEVASSFVGLQKSMADLLLSGKAPAGLKFVNDYTKELGRFDPNEAMKNPEKLLQRLQLFASKFKNVGIRNEIIRSFGLGDNMISALSRNAFNPQTLAKAPTYSDKEVKQLDAVYAQWEKIETRIKMAVGHFNAMHGGQLAKDIGGLVDKVVALAEAFVTLSDKLKLFELVGKAFEGWIGIFEGLKSAVDQINAINSPDKKTSEEAKAGLKDKAETAVYDLGNILEEAANGFKEAIDDLAEAGKHEAARAARESGQTPTAKQQPQPTQPRQNTLKGLQPGAPKSGAVHLKLVPPPVLNPQLSAPKVAPPAASTPAQKPPQVTITNHFQGDVQNPKAVGSEMERAVNAAFRQLSSQSQGT